MASCAEQVQQCLVGMVKGRATDSDGLSRGLRRLAAKALWSARGGREARPDEADDLVQELLVKVLTLRAQKGAAVLAAEWAAMPAPKFAAYVRAMLRNLAIEENPAWDTQRALRDVVKGALAKGLPPANGLPAGLEKGGRFTRALVAAACAELVARGVPENFTALTSALMAEFALGAQPREDVEAVQLPTSEPTALEAIAEASAGQALAESFQSEVGPEGMALWSLRGLGVAEAAKRLGMALSTTYTKYARVQEAFGRVAKRHRADRADVARAIELLSLA